MVAKVNGEDISVHRFQLFRARADGEPAQSVDPSRLMDGLVDRVLFAQKATKLELDRRGFVPLAIEEARTDILARAYVDSLLGSDDEREVDKFYAEHPQLFRERRIFRVFELAVTAPPSRIAALKERTSRARGLQEVADWLKSNRLAFNVGGVTKASEHLAPSLHAVLSGMKEGETRVLEVPGGAAVLQLVQSEPAPLSREAAAPMIEELLRARKRQEIAVRESKYLRSVASIEYGVDLGKSPAAAQLSD